MLAAIAFTLEYAIGGNDVASVATVGWAMIGVHALIGIGEGVITALTVSAVMSSRPDLVYGAGNLTFASRPSIRSDTGGGLTVRTSMKCR